MLRYILESNLVVFFTLLIVLLIFSSSLYLALIILRYIDAFKKPSKQKIIFFVSLLVGGLIFNYIGQLSFIEELIADQYIIGALIFLYVFTGLVLKSISESIAHYNQRGRKLDIFYPSLSKFLTAGIFLAIGVITYISGIGLSLGGARGMNLLQRLFVNITHFFGLIIWLVGLISLLLLLFNSSVFIFKKLSLKFVSKN